MKIISEKLPTPDEASSSSKANSSKPVASSSKTKTDKVPSNKAKATNEDAPPSNRAIKKQRRAQNGAAAAPVKSDTRTKGKDPKPPKKNKS